MPITYSYSNQGEDLGYQVPFNFNSLSLHPKHKWITAHIGSVSMNFSPYTLSGHQFTGGGIDLTPNGAWSFSAMSGRLLKATEDDGDARTQPAFDRFGYGLKTTYKKDKYKVRLIAFYAKDDKNSLDSIPEIRNILPQENFVLSIDGEVKLSRNLTFAGEHASTAITKDLRSPSSGGSSKFSLANILLNQKTSTAVFNAFKTNINYTIGKATVGLGYERIDPRYETLGAYFFNNDFENITINATNSIF